MSGIVLNPRSALLILLALAVALGACGDDGESSPDAPAAADIPSGAVAVVGDDPITRRELDRRVAAMGKGRREPRPGEREQRRRQALALLLHESAIEQEAARRGVKVSDAEVRRRLKQAKRGFSKPGDFRRFLGGQSEQDLRAQLRTQMLTQRLTEEADGDGPPKSVGELLRDWRTRTACRDGSAAAGCGNATVSK